jgi:hypothetical protein
MKRHVLSITLGVGILTAASATAACAQGVNLQVVPKIGLFMPINALAESAEIDMGLAFGVAGELLLPGPLNLRANLDFANTTAIMERSAAERRLGEATLLAVAGDVVLRPLPATAAAQPYFLGGVGMKRYEIDLLDAGSGALAGVAGTTTRFALHIGGGLDVRFGPLAFVLELGDYISTFETAGESRLQNDLFGMIGFRVAMF